MPNLNDVIHFWFEELESKDWFDKNPGLDARIRDKFLSTHAAVIAGETADWRDQPEGRLAEILVLDQLSRNMFRDKPEAFQYDYLALALAQETIRSGDDQKLPADRRSWIYMPFMHSESKVVHEKAVQLFSEISELKGFMEYEIKHKTIVDRFGRYPHRNKILGRESTPEEIEFLKGPGSSF